MRSVLFAFAILVAVTASGSGPEQPALENVGNIMVAFGAHLETRPLVGAEDLYKFLHQAVYGPGHAISDRGAAEAWLESEIEGLGPPTAEELPCEALGGESPLVRVNLRPFVERRGDAHLLFDAFIVSANLERGSSRRMEVVLSLAASYVQCAGRGELAPELRTLTAELAEKGFPAIHHSEAYVEAYAPAYRVVDEALAAEHGWCREN